MINEAVLSEACEDKNVDIVMLYIVLHLKMITENRMKIIAKYAKVKPPIFCSRGVEHTTNMKTLLEDEGVPAFSSVVEWVSAASTY